MIPDESYCYYYRRKYIHCFFFLIENNNFTAIDGIFILFQVIDFAITIMSLCLQTSNEQRLNQVLEDLQANCAELVAERDILHEKPNQSQTVIEDLQIQQRDR